MPLWPEPKRGAPNAVLRAALFAAIQGKGRQYMLRKELIATQDGVTIRYTGGQLDQADLGRMGTSSPLGPDPGPRHGVSLHGERLSQNPRPPRRGRSDREWLRYAFARLTATAVEISDGRRTYGGNLMNFYRDEDTGRTALEINPKLARFFGRSQWTQIDWEQRQQLRGKPLALWLHGFYASHAAPYPLTVAYLHQLSGSQTKQLKHFKQNLGRALRDLEAIGAIKAFEIVGDLVHVWTIPSPSQQKHLAARRPPGARRRK